MKNAPLIGLWLVAAAGACWAQAIPAATQPGTKYEGYLGFSKLAGDFGADVRPRGADGWVIGMTTRFNPFLGLDANLSSNYAAADAGHDRNTALQTLLVGPRFSVPIHMFSVSLNAGLGLARWQRAGWGPHGLNPPGNPIGAAESVGIGFDVHLFRNFTYRLVQVEYIHTPFLSGQNGLFTTGLVYGFGRR